MPLTINTNMAASRASYFLSKNNDALQKSLDRLSSGRRITQPSDDAGGLAVSMKLQGSIDNLKGAANNVANAISFLQVQDGILDSVGQIVSRISELYGMSQGVLNTSTPAIFDSEIADLIGQLDDLTSSEFNGVALFDAAAGKDVVATSTINISQSALTTALVSGTIDLTDNSETTTTIKAEIDAAAGNDPLGDILSAVATLQRQTMVAKLIVYNLSSKILPLKFQISRPPMEESWMWILQLRPRTSPNSKFWCRHPRPWWHRQTQPIKSHSCYSSNFEHILSIQ